MKIYYRFLDFLNEARPDAKQKREHKAVKNGPMGTLDSYQQVYAGDGESAWYVATVKQAKKPKTIIFADPLIAKRARTGYEYELLDALVKNHDVYVWQGSHKPLVSYAPVNSSAAIWSEHNVVADNATQIKNSIVKQGLDVNQFIILDLQQYHEMLSTIIMDEIRERSIDNKQITLSPDEILILKIASMAAIAPNKIQFKGIEPVFIDITEEELGQKKKPSRSKPSSKSINSNNHVNYCNLSDKRDNKQPNFSEEMQSLTFESHACGYADFSRYKNLQHLTVINSSLSDLVLPKAIVSLVVINCISLNSIDVRDLKQLKSVKVLNCSMITSFKANEQLSHLQLRNCYSLDKVDLEGIKNLHTLEVTNPKAGFVFSHFESLISIDHLRLIKCGESEENLQQFIAQLQNNYSMDLRRLPLTTLTLSHPFHHVNINDCSALKQIDATQSMTLQKLIVSSCHPELQYRVSDTCTDVRIHDDHHADAGLSATINKESLLPYVADISTKNNIEKLTVSNVTMLDVAFYPATLKFLMISDCNSPGKILDLSRFNKLETIVIHNVTYLSVVNNLPSTVKNIYISECPDLHGINLDNVKELYMLYLSKLDKYVLYGCKDLTRISRLHIQGNLDDLYDLANIIKNLDCQSIQLEDSNIRYLDSNLPKTLTDLRLTRCHHLMDVTLGCDSVKKLHLIQCGALARVSLGENKLEELVITDNPELSDRYLLLNQDRLKIAVMAGNDTYRQIRLDGKGSFERSPTDEECKSYNDEKIAKSFAKEVVSPGQFIETITNGVVRSQIERLDFTKVNEVILDARYIQGIRILPDLSKFTNMTTLTLRQMIVPDISQLPPNLNGLALIDCISTSTTLDFSGHPNLSTIVLQSVIGVDTVKGFNQNTVLEIIDCQLLQSVDLTNHERFNTLKIRSTNEKQSPKVIGNNLTLGSLIFSGVLSKETITRCSANVKLIEMFGLFEIDQQLVNFPKVKPIVRYLNVSNCNKLNTLELSELSDLTHLQILKCIGLTEVTGIPKSLEILSVKHNARLSLDTCNLTNLKKHSVRNNGFYQVLKQKYPQYSDIDLIPIVNDYASSIGHKVSILSQFRGDEWIIEGSEDTLTEVRMPDLSKRNEPGIKRLNLVSLSGISGHLLPERPIDRLSLDDCKVMTHDLDLSKHKFTFITFNSVYHLEKLTISPTTINISLVNCGRITELDLSNVKYFDSIKLENINRKFNIIGLDKVIEIKSLSIDGNTSPEILPRLLENKQYKSLEILNNDKIDSLIIPASTRHLNIKTCAKLTRIIFESYENIESLSISDCSALQDIQLPYMLKKIILIDNRLLNIPDLHARLNKLQRLTAATIKRNFPEMSEIIIKEVTNNSITSLEQRLVDSNQTSIINVSDQYTPDNPNNPVKQNKGPDSNGITTLEHRAGCLVTLYAKDEPQDTNKHYYRFNTFNKVSFDSNTQHLVFARNLDGCVENFKPLVQPHRNTETLDEIRRIANRDTKRACGNIVVLLGPGTPLPIVTTPITNPENNIVFYSNQVNLIDFEYDKLHQKAYIKLKPGVNTSKIELSYHFIKSNQYLIACINDDINVVVLHEPLLDDRLRRLIDNLIDREPRLHFLRDHKLPITVKLNYLRCYCKGFKDAEIIDNNNPSTLKILFDIITKRKGVCRHRSEAFMLLAHYLNVPTNMQTNGLHAFIELPTLDVNGQQTILGVDLGGRDDMFIRDILTPQNERDVDPFLAVQQEIATRHNLTSVARLVEVPNKAEEKKPVVTVIETPKSEAAKVEQPIIAPIKAAKTEISDVATEIPIVAEAIAEQPKPTAEPLTDANASEFIATKKQLADSKNELFPPVATLSSIVALLDVNGPRAPLFKLTPEMDPLLINQAILRELQHFKRDDLLCQHLYIHTPADINRYLDTIVIKDGERRIIRGRLHDLLENGGLLIINWSTFTTTQKSSFMCMLEKDGTLRGHDVSSKLFIINLLNIRADSACEAFLTRTTLFNLSPHYCDSWKLPSVIQNNNNILKVDLFGLPNWQERLFGEVVNQGRGLELLDNGALLQAINAGKTLTIYNPPNQPAIDIFIRRLLTERKFLHNGCIMQIPDWFTVQVDVKNNPLALDNVKVYRMLQENPKPGIFINANNLQQCYKRRIVDNATNQALTQPGWLQAENNFYITDFISSGEWQELLTHIAQYPERQFSFTLLEGAEIEGIATSLAVPQCHTLSHVIYTNDHDFCANQLALYFGDNADIIDMTPDTTYDQLIAVSKDKRDDHGQMLASYKTKLLADAIADGRVVILNGAINRDLYQLLLPYLYPELSTHYHNDAKVVCKGELYCIMPLANRQQYEAMDYHIQHFGLEDYRHLLPADQLDDIEKLERLVAKANELPHNGIGHPVAAPELTFQSYQYNLARIRNRDQLPHASNPTKGLLLSSYPQTSTTYQQLNDTAKTLLARNNAPLMKPVHEHKPFEQLKQLMADQGTHVIFLKGTHGTSKSYSLRELEKELPKGQYYKGINDIKAWLKAKPINEAQRLPIAIDEANMYLPGFFDILKGILRGTVVYHGKKYNTTPNHLVLLTGNFESYPNRYFHPFFEQYAETIIFTMPTDEWLAKYFIQPMLTELDIVGEDAIFVKERLLWVFNHISDYQPLLDLSLRDMKSLVQRFALCYGTCHPEHSEGPRDETVQNNEATKELNSVTSRSLAALGMTKALRMTKALGMTAAHEFTLGFDDPCQRQRFLNAINYKAPAHQQEVRKLKDLYIPSEKFDLIDIIEEDLALCDAAVAQGKSYRYGVLLEGSSGVGKSSIYKAILESKGYSKNSEDPAKRYYMVSVDNSNSAALNLLKAYFNGSKIILDEINLSPEIEELLNDLLEGVLPTNPIYADLIREASIENPVPRKGFFVLATQNPGTMIGRGVSSLALMNRFHRLLLEAYTDIELLKILRSADIQDPERVLREFNAASARDPEFYNTRKLFEWMKTPEALLIPPPLPPLPNPITPTFVPVQPQPAPVEPVITPEPKPAEPEPLPAPTPKPPKWPTVLKWTLVGLIALTIAALAVGIAVASGGTAVPLLVGVAIGAFILAGGVGGIIAKFGFKSKKTEAPAPMVDEPIIVSPSKPSVVLAENPKPLFKQRFGKRKAVQNVSPGIASEARQSSPQYCSGPH